jgi:hypothetical protein
MASFPPAHCSFSDIQNTTILQRAFEDVIPQMGVTLTELGKQAVYYVDKSFLASELSFAKGVGLYPIRQTPLSDLP